MCGGRSAPCSFLINTIASFPTAGIMNVSLPQLSVGPVTLVTLGRTLSFAMRVFIYSVLAEKGSEHQDLLSALGED